MVTRDETGALPGAAPRGGAPTSTWALLATANPSYPSAVVEAAISAISEGDWARASIDIYSEHLRNFVCFLECGLAVRDMADVGHQEVERFVLSPRADGSKPSTSVLHYRRSAVRALYRVGRHLGLLAGDPTLDIALPSRDSDWCRPLTDAEIDAARSASVNSLTNTRRAVAWALAEAFAQTVEIALATVGDLDLDRNRIWLRGGPRTRPRWTTFTQWGRAQIDWRLRTLTEPEGDVSLIAWRRPPANPRSAANCIIGAVLDGARIHGPDVHPRSVPAWRALTEYQEGTRLEVVAAMLGVNSLDVAARVLGLEAERGWER